MSSIPLLLKQRRVQHSSSRCEYTLTPSAVFKFNKDVYHLVSRTGEHQGRKPLSPLVCFLTTERCLYPLKSLERGVGNKSVRYNEGLNLYKTFACSDLNNTINVFGQNCESGRDQAHTQLGLGNMAELCQTAYNQGDHEYWGLLEDRLQTGYEYTARYNLGNEVPYDPGFYRLVTSKLAGIGGRTLICMCRCGANLVGGPWQVISNSTRGHFRPVYEIAYGYYAQLQRKEMPFTREVIQKFPIEAGDTVNNVGDSAPYGTLRFRRLAGIIAATMSN